MEHSQAKRTYFAHRPPAHKVMVCRECGYVWPCPSYQEARNEVFKRFPGR